MHGQDDSIAAACRYVLVGLLQRLEAQHSGLVDDLRTGIQSDRAASIQGGNLAPEVDATFLEALRIPQLAKGGKTIAQRGDLGGRIGLLTPVNLSSVLQRLAGRRVQK